MFSTFQNSSCLPKLHNEGLASFCLSLGGYCSSTKKGGSEINRKLYHKKYICTHLNSCVTFVYVTNNCMTCIQRIMLGFTFHTALVFLACRNTAGVSLHVNLSQLKWKSSLELMFKLLEFGGV